MILAVRVVLSLVLAHLFALICIVPFGFALVEAEADIRSGLILGAIGLGVWGLAAILVFFRVRIRYLATALTLVALVLWAQASDEAKRPAPPDLGPVLAESSETNRLFLQMSKTAEGNRVAEVHRVPEIMLPKNEAWIEFVQANEAKIETAWKADEIGRHWCEAVAQARGDGVVPREAFSQPFLDFQCVRQTVFRRIAYAWLLAHKGQPDDAIDVLLPAIGMGYTIQRSCGSMTEGMIGVVVVRMSTAALATILDHRAPTAAARLRARKMLQSAVPVDRVLQTMILAEAKNFRHLVDHMRETTVARPNKHETVISRLMHALLTQRFIFHFHRTERLSTEHALLCLQLARQRGFDAHGRLRDPYEEHEWWRNPGGRILLAMGISAIHKTAQSVWEADDRRLALIQRLEQP